jgi:hypothetical protein
MILRYRISGLHLFWQYIVPILALFQGRVIDILEDLEATPADPFATGGEIEHEVRSTFQPLKGLLCEASAGQYGWWDTLFHYQSEVKQANNQRSGSTFSEVPMCVLEPLKYLYTF